MIKKILLITVILITLNSCKQNEYEKAKGSEEKELLEIEKDIHELNLETDSYIQNDSLTNILINELESIISNSKFIIEKKPIQNKHIDNLVDTIITRSFENTIITSYKTINKELIYKAKIENNDFELANFIKIGTKKYIIEKSLAIGINKNILKIGSSEGTLEFNLKFESGILKLIEFEGYID